MHVGRCPARVDNHQRAEPALAVDSVSDEPRAVHDGSRRGHQHRVEFGLCTVDAFRVHDALDEHLADGRARRFDIEHVEFRHHVAGDDDGFAGERGTHVISRGAITGVDDGAGERAIS
jgi:hypothetical protein